MSGTEPVPKSIVPNQRTAFQCLFHLGRNLAFRIVPTQFECQRLQVVQIIIDGLFRLRLINVHHRHVDDFFQILAELFLYLASRLSTFHYNEVGRTGSFQHGEYFVKVTVGLVQVNHDAVLAHQEGIFQLGHFISGHISLMVLQVELGNVFPIGVGNVSASGRGTVQVMVVHQDKHTILGTLNINFQHVHSHLNGTLDSFQRVFGKVTPIGTMSHYNHATFITSKELFSDAFGSRRSRFLLCTCRQGTNTSKKYK